MSRRTLCFHTYSDLFTHESRLRFCFKRHNHCCSRHNGGSFAQTLNAYNVVNCGASPVSECGVRRARYDSRRASKQTIDQYQAESAVSRESASASAS